MNSKRSKLSFTGSALREKDSREDPSLPSVENYEI